MIGRVAMATAMLCLFLQTFVQARGEMRAIRMIAVLELYDVPYSGGMPFSYLAATVGLSMCGTVLTRVLQSSFLSVPLLSEST